MLIDLSIYGGLFLAAFLAATLFPAQSELILAGLLTAGGQPVWALIAVASLGNILGSAVNWVLGRYLHRFRDRRWFPARADQLARAENWYRRYGRWSLLASWVPVIGDPLTLAAGVLGEPLRSFLLIVTVAKVGRYLAVAAAALKWAA